MSADYYRMAASPNRRVPLARGQACQNCRRRKIKCDGSKPTCTACLSNKRLVQPCSYKEPGLPRTRALESQIAELQERIHELESRTPGVTLYKPYEDPILSASPPLGDSNADPWSGSATPESSIDHWSCQYTHELPKSTSDDLLNGFLQHSKELGFFLDLSRFQLSVSLPPGHPDRPPLALLSVIHLWGLCLSQETPSPTEKMEYLSRSLHALAELPASSHHSSLLHRIQAEVLLTVWYFNEGKCLEGKCHAGIAIALAIDAGMHQMRRDGAAHLLGNANSANSLSLPKDGVEEGEYIDCFWTLYTLENIWSSILQSPSGFGFLHPGLHVDTPWPLEDGEYKEVSAQYTGSQTVRRFLDGPNVLPINPIPYGEQSSKALLAKASILFYNATQLERQFNAGLQAQEEVTRYSLVWQTLVGSIERFMAQISPTEHPSCSALSPSTILTHALTHAAYMKVHGILLEDITSRDRNLDAACSVYNTIAMVDLKQPAYINPVFGFLWSFAGDAILREITRLQRYLEHDSSCMPTVQNLSNIYYNGLAIMTRLQARSSLRTCWAPLPHSLSP
ncbi:hypothetical protein AX16_010145 [Volvariella volvacea WC 439]|nr:hypothetical protein AX16_010145 [Volvariella volvacea WC 439]